MKIPDAEGPRGEIYPMTLWWVTCAECLHTEGNDEYGYCTKGEFPRLLKQEGWVETDRGWICPECAGRMKK